MRLTPAGVVSNSSAALDEQFIRRAIRLAMNGRGRVEPNPMVGCVIVKDGRVIGEGHHAQYGGPHAEPTALANCTEPPDGATAYVTLEPCCHTNKQTPPCAPRLIEAKLARVVIGCLDPNPAVNGKGVAMLREAGIRVDGPVLEAPEKQLIAPFVLDQIGTRPWVTVKWAESADGRVAGAGGRPVRISSQAAQALVHELRSRLDGILVGVNTILTDDPLLNARYAATPRHPTRLVLDRRLLTPPTARALRDHGSSLTIFCGHDTSGPFRRRRDALEEAGARVTSVALGPDGRLDLGSVLTRVRGGWTRQLLVEPGPTLARSFFATGLVDRVWVFRSSSPITDAAAPGAAKVPGEYVTTGTIDVAGDTLTEDLTPASPVFFAAEPSADFVLAAEQFGSE